MLEHGRTRYSTSVTIAREGGTRAEVNRGSERREENEFIFLSGVASCKHIVCGSRYKPRCPERETNCGDLLRDKVVDGFQPALIGFRRFREFKRFRRNFWRDCPFSRKRLCRFFVGGYFFQWFRTWHKFFVEADRKHLPPLCRKGDVGFNFLGFLGRVLGPFSSIRCHPRPAIGNVRSVAFTKFIC